MTKPQGYNMTLPGNKEYVQKTMEVAIEDSSHPTIDEFAERLWLIGGVKAIFDFCHDRVVYCKDNVMRDTLRHPHVLIERACGERIPHAILSFMEEKGIDKVILDNKTAGDCDCKSSLCTALLLNRGYKVRLVGAHHVQPVNIIPDALRVEALADYKRGVSIQDITNEINRNLNMRFNTTQVLNDLNGKIRLQRPETNEEKAEINHVYLEYKEEDNPNQVRWFPLEPSSRTEGWGRIAPGVLPLYTVVPTIGGEIVSGVKKKIETGGKVIIPISLQVGSYIVSLQELNSYTEYLPAWIDPNFKDAFNKAFNEAFKNGTVDIDTIDSPGKILLERFITKMKELKLTLQR